MRAAAAALLLISSCVDAREPGSSRQATSCEPHMIDSTDPDTAELLEDYVIVTTGEEEEEETWTEGGFKEVSVEFDLVDEDCLDAADTTACAAAKATLTCTSACEAGGHCQLTGCDPNARRDGCTVCRCRNVRDPDCAEDGCTCEKKVTVSD